MSRRRAARAARCISAADQGLAALGYTVSYAALEEVLERRLAALGASVSWGTPCEAIELDAQLARLRLADGERVEARLLVLADGGANARRVPGLAYSEKDYGQVAITGPVHTDRPHRGRAYERFTPRGPVALLPVGERYALVWTASPAESARILALDDAAFLEELQAHFGDRAGRFVAAGSRASFPLKLRTINSTIALRTVIVGNAAQAMHPIAGQGLNVGLRDAASLAAILAADPAGDPGDGAVLEAYRRFAPARCRPRRGVHRFSRGRLHGRPAPADLGSRDRAHRARPRSGRAAIACGPDDSRSAIAVSCATPVKATRNRPGQDPRGRRRRRGPRVRGGFRG